MMVVWKHELGLVDLQTIMIPEGAEFLCAREQINRICVWFRCDPSKPVRSRILAIVGTGNSYPDADGRYLGTVSLNGGQLMFHVFERN